MKFILSRKGFDAENGGSPSPILPNKQMISIPIPDETGLPYSNLILDENKSYLNLMNELRIKPQSLYCHLDPDINYKTRPRCYNWRGLFGQSGATAGHLRKQGIGSGDIFLFYGTFQKTKVLDNRLEFDSNDTPKHIIYGYLQIDEVIKSDYGIKPWMGYHPHALRGWENNNTIYLAREFMSFKRSAYGYGVFDYDKELVLTAEGQSKSRWSLPEFMKGKITYHTEKSWKNNYFQSNSRGQEFILTENEKITKWGRQLLEKHS